MAGSKPNYNVCVSQRKEDKSPSRCIQIGAAWVGEKGQINIRVEEQRKVVAAFIEAEYDLVLFKSEPF